MHNTTDFGSLGGDLGLSRAVAPGLILCAYEHAGDPYPSAMLTFRAKPGEAELDELAEAVARLNYGEGARYQVWDVRKLCN